MNAYPGKMTPNYAPNFYLQTSKALVKFPHFLMHDYSRWRYTIRRPVQLYELLSYGCSGTK
jgi:hypothetical protein